MSKAQELVKDRRILDGRDPLWIVGRLVDDQGKWVFQGVFADEEAAIRSCQGEDYFVAPATIGKALSAVDGEWQGLYFPLAKVTA